ncbi:hypothetical protein L915_11680 [Phytophthora nicotianae]|uniref:PPM-type phosphatase domain-containing protein n=1 Tax=Phytophthora nicotianae TaxID=4792 RepID=W2GJ50_PHYNI|nr:hypothetical protein L915_11680 [Phytophthora nicotianae]ETL36411.1 hypothetical protein L916_11600 [Phytophthora nicotianae]
MLVTATDGIWRVWNNNDTIDITMNELDARSQ